MPNASLKKAGAWKPAGRVKCCPDPSIERQRDRAKVSNPKKSPLWQCAHRHYDEFEAAYPEAYQPRYGVLRRIIPEVVHKFLECGNLERGFAQIRCDHCEHEYLLAFSCKSRWFCPSCHQKNVQTTARFILDQVVAAVQRKFT